MTTGYGLDEEQRLESAVLKTILFKTQFRGVCDSLANTETVNSEHKTEQLSLWSLPQETLKKSAVPYILDGVKEEEPRRISFLSNDSTPYTALLMRMRASRQGNSITTEQSAASSRMSLILSPRSEVYTSRRMSQQSDNLGGNETILLDMVRERSRELEDECQGQTLNLPRDDNNSDDEMEPCMHGLSMRMTERSVSRSRVSRMSTRRDMDIPSILAFTTSTPAPTHLEIPAFQKIRSPTREEAPRWSIRRSVCPVCSQKWKDRSSISNVKYSGLKRNSSLDLPSVIAPARLRTSITLGYVPRPTLAAVDEDTGVVQGGLRNTSASWQLTRARRFRTPRPQLPPPEATAPPSATAPLARKDLDLRVNRFLSDEALNMIA